MPAWTGLRSRSPAKAYASLLSHKDDDRLSPGVTHFRRGSSAQSDVLSSASSDDGAYYRDAQSLAIPTQSGRHARLASDKTGAPAPVAGSKSSYSTDPLAQEERGEASKRLGLKKWSVKVPFAKSGSAKEQVKPDKAQKDKEATPHPVIKTAHKKHKKESKEAQTVLQLITGLDTIYVPFTNLSIGSNATTPQYSSNLPDVSSKDVKKLKSSLENPKKASQIIRDLKKIPVDGASLAKDDTIHTNFKTRAACLECIDSEAVKGQADAGESPFADEATVSPSSANTTVTPKGHTKQISGADLFTGKFQALSAVAGDGVPTSGKIFGQVFTSTGTFSALAGVTGRLIEASGSHEGLISPPVDRMSILIYWWGYELVLPPPSLACLGNARSVAGTLFTLLQALAVTGGVPEVAPFVRYISFYIDMEWKAISAQNKGKGVVLAATWVVPVAVVPRPFDLA